MKLKKTLILLSFLFLGACGNSGTPSDSAPPSPPSPPADVESTVLSPGDYQKNIIIGSDLRTYILHVPTHYDGSKALPLVYILHGYGGSAAGMVKLTGMSERADEENFFVAYLQGTKSTDGSAGWNSNLTPDTGITADDVGFVRELTQNLMGQVNLDTHRVYAAGFSNGGFMAHRLGAELPDVLAGVAVVEGTVGISHDNGVTYLTTPAAQGPIPVLMIHGEQDTHVLYDGGVGVVDVLYAKPVSAAVDFWTSADACTGDPQEQTSTDGNVLTEDYTSCANGSEVELLSIVNGRHEWPTLEGHTGFSATDAIWDFFSRHSKTNF